MTIIGQLIAALQDAREGLEEMLPYVPEYFQKKWQLREYITRADAALAEVGSYDLPAL